MPTVANSQIFYIDSTDPIPAKEYLQGYLELEDTLIVGSGGLRKFRQENGEVSLRQPLDGAFIGFFKASNECILTTDISGQELLYYYQYGSEWAVCNSLYFMHNAIKNNGWPLTPHHQAIQSLGTHAWNAQPYTQQTVFKEVRLLAPTEFVTVPNQTDTKSGPVLPIERQLS